MRISNIEEKKNFYEEILKGKTHTFVLCKRDNVTVPLYIQKSHMADSGFYELHCQLFGYTFTKGNNQQEKFMKEQEYVIIGNKAYDVQTPFSFFEFDKYFGEFEEINKEKCVQWLREHGEQI